MNDEAEWERMEASQPARVQCVDGERHEFETKDFHWTVRGAKSFVCKHCDYWATVTPLPAKKPTPPKPVKCSKPGYGRVKKS